MIRSSLLFAHIVGMLTLFAGFGLELVALDSRRRGDGSSPWTRIYRALPRVYGIAFALILLSGIYMAARVAVHQFAWVRLSFVMMLLMGIAGAPAIIRRVSEPLIRASIYLRIALGLAAVYLMISKVGLGGSLLAIGVALFAAAITIVYNRQPSGA